MARPLRVDRAKALYSKQRLKDPLDLWFAL